MKSLKEALVHKYINHRSSIDSDKLFKDAKNIYILHPYNEEDIDQILECACDVNNNDRPEIEDHSISHDVIVFLGKGEEFRKLHPLVPIQCDIYWTPDYIKKAVINLLDEHIHGVTDFKKHPDHFKKIHSGKINL